MDVKRRATVARSLASAATAAGLVLASWSTPANAASSDNYHGVDVSNMTSDIAVISAPTLPTRVPNSDVFSPRDEKGREDDKSKPKSNSGTGSKSKAGAAATGASGTQSKVTKDASKAAVAATGASGTNSAVTKDSTKAATGASGTNSAVTKDTTKNEVAAAANNNTAANMTVAANAAAAATVPAANGVVNGVQTNGTPAAVNGTQTMGGAVAGAQTNGVVNGVGSLPSTSTAESLSLAGAGLALIASGGSMLVIKRRRK